ncbi:MAG: hypothetical protein H0X03_09585 [Nitrosopumilus sp.]|nr:hypothetical protein [Nitrosopumilus sp.]MBA3751121.1 hypothetical protein [Nitrosopumilus sp.]MDQ3084849.1 hypothetical protein [Thermoproteota archaeon]
MEGIKDNNDSDSNLDPKDESGITKKFLIEIFGKFKTTSTIELSNYEEALELFNQRSKEGKNLILYEIHKSLNDGSIVKKVPVLNTSKHAERMRVLQEELKESNPAINGTVNAPISSTSSSSPDQKSKTTLGTMKFKIIILAAIIAGFILTLFMLDIIAGGGSGNMSGHLVAFEGLQTYLQTTTNINYDYNHQDLVAIYFLL